jgi:putative ABC transport system permease protein
MRIAGTVHDMAMVPAQFDNSPYGYISFETVEWFGEDYGLNELNVVAARPQDKEFAQQVVNQVKDKVEKNGFTIPMSLVAEPGQLPLDDILQAILILMGFLGLLSLFLSVFLIVNTVTALLAQQRRQIGVMKAIGARSGQLAGMYLVMVMAYGLMALVIAAPLSIVGSRALSRFLAAMFNFDLLQLEVPSYAILVQLAVGLLVPVLASLYPFAANLRVTAAQAMSTVRLGRGRFGTGGIDRLLSGANLWFARRVLLRPVLLSVRNIFRSKGRLVLTLLTLVLAGAIFIGVFSVSASLNRTVDDLMKLWNFDSLITFDRPYRAVRVEDEAQMVPGVVETDVWLQLPVRRVRDDDSEGQMIYMFAAPAGSRLVPGPAIVEGRWLLPEDENAVVVDAILLKQEPDLHVGGDIVLKVDGKDRHFTIVGMSMGMMSPMAYANYPYIARITGNVGEADAALVDIGYQDEESVLRVTRAVENHLEDSGMRVSVVGTMSVERAEAQVFFSIIVNLLLIMALMLALVGGLGLMGTMSINVLERTREIGVLRAIGSPNRGVAQVFILEGVAIGVMSWFLGALLAYPLGGLLCTAVGVPLLGSPLTFAFSFSGVWIWLALVVILSAIASFIPARNASRLTVREVLAYE